MHFWEVHESLPSLHLASTAFTAQDKILAICSPNLKYNKAIFKNND